MHWKKNRGRWRCKGSISQVYLRVVRLAGALDGPGRMDDGRVGRTSGWTGMPGLYVPPQQHLITLVWISGDFPALLGYLYTRQGRIRNTHGSFNNEGSKPIELALPQRSIHPGGKTFPLPNSTGNTKSRQNTPISTAFSFTQSEMAWAPSRSMQVSSVRPGPSVGPVKPIHPSIHPSVCPSHCLRPFIQFYPSVHPDPSVCTSLLVCLSRSVRPDPSTLSSPSTRPGPSVRLAVQVHLGPSRSSV